VTTDTSVHVEFEQDSAGGSQLFTNGDCSSGSSVADVVIANGTSSATVYFRNATASFASLRATAAGKDQGWASVTVVGTTVPTGFRLEMKAMDYTGSTAHLITGACYELEARLYGGGLPEFPTNDQVRSFTLSAISGSTPAAYYVNLPDCSVDNAPITSMSFAATEARKKIYFKPGTASGTVTATGSPNNYSTPFDVSTNTITTLSVVKNSTGGGGGGVDSTVNKLIFASSPVCFPIRIQTRAANSATTYPSNSFTVSLSSTDFLFADNNTCTGATATKSTVVSSQGGSGLYAQPVNGAVLSGIVTVSSTSPALSTGTLFIKEPDQLLVSQMPVGSNLMQNYCQKLTLEAKWSGSTINAPTEFHFIANTNMLDVYTNDTCTTPLGSSSIVMPAGMITTKFFFVKSNAAPATMPGLNISLNGAGMMSTGNIPFSVVTAPFFRIVRSSAGTMTSNQCVGLMPGWNNTDVGPAPITATLSVTNSANLFYHGTGYFFGDSTCTTAIGTPTVILFLPANTNHLTPPSVFIKFVSGSFTSGSMPEVKMEALEFFPQIYINAPTSCSASSCNWP